MDINLERLGWTDELQTAFEPYSDSGLARARVAVEHKEAYVLYVDGGEIWARVAGRMLHRARDRSALPAVGDWVAIERNEGWSTIQAVLPRTSAFVRKEPGEETTTQVLAANFETVWILAALTAELSARRIERYLAVAWGSGAQPVLVLTKADLGESDADRIAEAEAVAMGCPVHVTSAVTGEGLDEVAQHLEGQRTAVVLGSSGVGKSTLINALLGEARLETHATRGDDVGRHTTTHRELVILSGGGMLIDTPGLREVALWDGGGTDTLFDDVTALAAQCKFANCGHRREPGCAIRAAIAAGELEEAHVHAYDKMQRELAYLARKQKYRGGVDWRRKQHRGSDRARARRFGTE